MVLPPGLGYWRIWRRLIPALTGHAEAVRLDLPGREELVRPVPDDAFEIRGR